jgi:hypothetical protein
MPDEEPEWSELGRKNCAAAGERGAAASDLTGTQLAR